MYYHKKVIWLFILWLLAPFIGAAPGITALISSVQNLTLRSDGNQVLLGRFLVTNPDLASFTLFVSFTQGCQIKHFTVDKAVPLQKITLRWSGGNVDLYDRGVVGGDCVDVLQWTIPDPNPAAYEAVYSIDILGDWDAGGSNVTLAGDYQETIDVIVVGN